MTKHPAHRDYIVIPSTTFLRNVLLDEEFGGSQPDCKRFWRSALALRQGLIDERRMAPSNDLSLDAMIRSVQNAFFIAAEDDIKYNYAVRIAEEQGDTSGVVHIPN